MGDSKTRGLEDDMFTKGRCGVRDNVDLRTCGPGEDVNWDMWTRRRVDLGTCGTRGLWDSVKCGLRDVWTWEQCGLWDV